MKISDLISSESKWTKHCLGRDKENRALNSFDVIYNTKFDKNGNLSYTEINLSELAKSFSLYGAVIRCYGVDGRDNVIDKLKKAIEAHTGKRQYLAAFNDNPSTQFTDIKAVMKIAGV